MTLAFLKNRYYFLAETFLLLVLPIWVFMAYPHIYIFRHLFLLAGIGYVYLVAKTAKFSLPDLGLTKQLSLINFTILFSLLFSGLLLFIAKYNYPAIYLFEIDQNNLRFPSFVPMVFYVLFSVPIQEIVFRGFYIRRLELITKNLSFQIIFSAFIFGLMHFPFANKILPLSTFFAGLWWAYLFIKTKSLLSPIIAHMIIGTVMIALSLYH